MNMRSYGKCEQCGKNDMLHCFWYNGVELMPWYFCDECMEEFDKAMEESAYFTLHGEREDDLINLL